MSGPARPRSAHTSRRWYALGAGAALVVTLVFVTTGDGVDELDAAGLRRVVIDVGHTAVWALLAVALGLAALRGSWGRASGCLAVAAGLTYVAFLAAVLA